MIWPDASGPPPIDRVICDAGVDVVRGGIVGAAASRDPGTNVPPHVAQVPVVVAVVLPQKGHTMDNEFAIG
jgi:hypothetical protein